MSGAWTRTVGVAGLCATLTACGGGNGDPVDAGTGGGADAEPSAACQEATEHSDLAWIQENILTPGCAAFVSCHQGQAASAADLNLEAGMSRDNLVGVPSQLFPDYDLVVEGDPENSYLMIILGHYEGPLPESGTMPFNNPLLCPQKREAIARWIEAGAPAASTADAGVADAGAPDGGS